MAENIIVIKSYTFSVKIVKFCFDMQVKTVAKKRNKYWS